MTACNLWILVYVLVKHLSDNDFKHLPQEFRCDLLKLVKQKGVYPYKYMDSFKKLPEKFW